MAQLNDVVVRGNLTKDAEYKEFENGQKLCTLNIGVNSKYTNSAGEEVKEASFFTIEAWNDLAELMKDSKKGQDIRTEGRLKQEIWEKDGKKNSTLKIVANKIDAFERGAEWKPENITTVEGNLTSDPEFKTFESGRTKCTFTVGVNRHYKNAAGEEKNSVNFVDVEAWGDAANKMKDAKKGQEFKTSGSLKQEIWEKDGVKHSKVKIQAFSIDPVIREKKQEKKSPSNEREMCF